MILIQSDHIKYRNVYVNNLKEIKLVYVSLSFDKYNKHIDDCHNLENLIS